MAFRFMPVAAAICEASKSGAQSRTICRILTSEIPERYACLFFLPMTRFQPFAWLKEFHVHGIKALGLGLAQTQHFQTDDAESCGMHG